MTKTVPFKSTIFAHDEKGTKYCYGGNVAYECDAKWSIISQNDITCFPFESTQPYSHQFVQHGENYYGIFDSQLYKFKGLSMQRLNVKLPTKIHSLISFGGELLVLGLDCYKISGDTGASKVQIQITTPLSTVSSRLPWRYYDLKFQETLTRQILINMQNLQLFKLVSLNDDILTVQSLVLNQLYDDPRNEYLMSMSYSCRHYSVLGFINLILFFIDYTEEIPVIHQGIWRLKFEPSQFQELLYKGNESWTYWFGLDQYQEKKAEYIRQLMAAQHIQ